MRKKTKILSLLLTITMSLTFLTMGVYSLAAKREININGTINFSYENAMFSATLYTGYGSGYYNYNIEDDIYFSEGVNFLYEDSFEFKHPRDQKDFQISNVNMTEVKNIFVYKVEFENLEEDVELKIEYSFNKPTQSWIHSKPYNTLWESESSAKYEGVTFAKADNKTTVGFAYIIDTEDDNMNPANNLPISGSFKVSKATEEDEMIYIDQILPQTEGYYWDRYEDDEVYHEYEMDVHYEYAYVNGILDANGHSRSGYEFRMLENEDSYEELFFLPQYDDINLVFRDYWNDGTHGKLPVISIRNVKSNNPPALIDLPKGLLSIENSSFNYDWYEPKYLIDVTLPENLVFIGDYAFNYSGLVNLKMNENIQFLGENVFSSNFLSNVNIPEGIKVISNGLFSDNRLTNVVLPNGVESIGDWSFSNNKLTGTLDLSNLTNLEYISGFGSNNLTNVVLPNNQLTEIGSSAFSYNKFTTVNIPNSVERIGNDAFYNNQLTSVTIPNSVESIGNSAFSYNLLISAIIGSNVSDINNYAFSNNNLSNLTFLGNGETETTIGQFAFQNNNLTNLVIGKNVKSIGNYAFWKNKLTTLTFEPDSQLETIGNNAFYGNNNGLENNIVELVIPNSVESIGSSAFRWNQLTILTFAEGSELKTITHGAFMDNKLVNLVIPNSVESIGDSAFSYNNLMTLNISNSVESIGQHAFANNQLIELNFEENSNLRTIDGYAFYKSELPSVEIPDSVESIGSHAFYGNKLTTINIPDSVESIGSSAFGSNFITIAIIGNSVTSISGVFSANNLLVQIVNKSPHIQNSPEAFGITDSNRPDIEIKSSESEFKNSLELSSDGKIWMYNISNDGVNITKRYVLGSNGIFNGHLDLSDYLDENYMYEVYDRAFMSNNISSLIIPNNITKLGYFAFGGLIRVVSITIGSSVTSMHYSFFNNYKLVRIINHSSLIDSYIKSHSSGHHPNLEISSSLDPSNFQHELKLSEDGKIWLFFIKDNNGNVLNRQILGYEFDFNGGVLDLNDYINPEDGNYEIYREAFWRINVSSLIMPDNIINIGYRAFFGSSVSNIVFSNNITIIKDDFFISMENLTSLVLPGSVIKIEGTQAFNSNIREITINSEIPPVIEGTESLFTYVQKFYVPADSVEAYKTADGWKDLSNIANRVFPIS